MDSRMDSWSSLDRDLLPRAHLSQMDEIQTLIPEWRSSDQSQLDYVEYFL